MKRVLIVLVLIALLPGCSGVILSAKYSALLDTTASLSAETARRAAGGNLTAEQIQQSLDKQAATWKLFQDARDGRAPEVSP